MSEDFDSANSITQPITDFSDKLGPVFTKELRQGLRAHQFVWPFVAVQVIAVAAVGIEFLVIEASGTSEEWLAWFFFLLLGVIFTLLMPLTLFNSLQPELGEGKNVELLLMSNLTRWQIVRGKWMVGSVLSGLMLISLVPYILTRYFVGGVDLIDNFFGLLGLAMSNAVMNAIVIGASGFRNYLGRIVLIGLGIGTFAITASISAIAPAALFSGIGGSLPGSEIMAKILGFFLSGLTGALFVAYGLQLGRSKLKLFENPLDPPSSGLIIALIIFTPVIAGIISIIGVIGLLVLALFIDRGPGKNSKIRYAQP